ncbi:MAG TPA: hypothetical protein VJL62_02155 [Thermodesulfobacteriota bacterium]|nr:hypothetical protein [Thermodesulfobacteriota bacterium]
MSDSRRIMAADYKYFELPKEAIFAAKSANKRKKSTKAVFLVDVRQNYEIYS